MKTYNVRRKVECKSNPWYLESRVKVFGFGQAQLDKTKCYDGQNEYCWVCAKIDDKIKGVACRRSADEDNSDTQMYQ